jgi:flavodoxin
MKSIVVYFSLTGNTKKVAKAIYQGMREYSDTCDITTIKEMDVGHLTEYDLIVMGSPVWGGVPLNVRLFFNAAPSLKGKHALPFVRMEYCRRASSHRPLSC